MTEHPETIERVESFRRLATAAAFASLFAYAIVLIITQSLNNQVQAHYQTSFAQLGWLAPSMMVGFFAAVLVGGHYSDKIGKLPLLLVGCTSMAVGAVIFGSASTFAVAAGAILIMGIGGGFSEGTASALITDLYSGPRRASMMNLAQAAFGAGAVIVPIATGSMIRMGIDWRLAYLATAAICTLAGLATLGAVITRVEKPVGTNEPGGWRGIMTDPVIIMLSIGIFLYVGAELGQSNWMSVYFRHALGASPSVAAMSVSPLWLGIMVGRLGAAAALRNVSESALLCWVVGLGLIAESALLLVRTPASGLLAAFALGVFFGPVWPTIVSRAGAAYPTRTGLVTGIVVSVGSLGAAIVPAVIGGAADAVGIRRALWICSAIILVNLVVFIKLHRRNHFPR